MIFIIEIEAFLHFHKFIIPPFGITSNYTTFINFCQICTSLLL